MRTSPSTIKAFLFDLGNVLMKFSHERMHLKMGEVLRRDPQAVHDVLRRDRLQWRYECGLVTTGEVLQALGVRASGQEAALLLDALCDIFEPIEATLHLTRQLKAAGYKLVVVSNTNEAHLEYIRRRYKVLAPFDALVLSYEIKAMKPDPAFYAAALRAAGEEAANVFFIDDLKENVEGARAAGFTTHHFSSPEALVADLRARGISLA